MNIELNLEILETLALETLQTELNEDDTLNLLRIFSEEVLERSQLYCPFVNGRLKNSVKFKYSNNSYFISYNTPYAIYVHELIGNKHKPPTRAKFLENAFFTVYREFYLEFGKGNIPPFDYKMTYSLEKVEMQIYIKGAL